MMYVGMGFEEVAQHIVVFCACALEWKMKLKNLDVGEMVVHIMAEAYLTIDLLLTGDMTVLHELHDHYLLFARGNEHEHSGSKIAAAERVLTEERKWLQIGHIRVEHDEWYLTLV